MYTYKYICIYIYIYIYNLNELSCIVYKKHLKTVYMFSFNQGVTHVYQSLIRTGKQPLPN